MWSQSRVGTPQDCYNYHGQDSSNQDRSVYIIDEAELNHTMINQAAIHICRDMMSHLPEHMHKIFLYYSIDVYLYG